MSKHSQGSLGVRSHVSETQIDQRLAAQRVHATTSTIQGIAAEEDNIGVAMQAQ